MVGWIAASRSTRAGFVAFIAVAVAAAWPTSVAPSAATLPPNFLIVLTDDQTIDTLPSSAGSPPMPWLQAQLQDPDQPWVRFSNAFVETPLCCPSRASILTGLTSPRTGVETNADGFDLDESSTLATWLDDAGYTTGLVGKYLNGFPWDRGPYVPAGWDRFVGKRNAALGTTYYGYDVIDQGVPLHVAPSRWGYATGLLASEAMGFLRSAPVDRPWFLLFSPSAPHAPWTPAPEDVGALEGEPVPSPTARVMNDVRAKPGWIQDLPAMSVSRREQLGTQRGRARETLLAVDRAMQAFVAQVAQRGELDRTVIVFLTDNGYSFGEHRWTGKRCPYEPCVRTPMVVRSPWASQSTIEDLVLNVDVAPTLLDFVRSSGPVAEPLVDGVSLRPYLDSRSPDPGPARPGVVLRYAGDAKVPAWQAVRTRHYSYIENADGSRELYDLDGTLGRADPNQVRNVAGDERFRATVRDLDDLLDSLILRPSRR